MTTNSQLKTFCLHLAVQLFSNESKLPPIQAQDIVVAANIFEDYLSIEEEEISFTADANILTFPTVNKEGIVDETPPETA